MPEDKVEMVKIRRKHDQPQTTMISSPGCTREFDLTQTVFEIPRSELLTVLHNGNFVEVREGFASKPPVTTPTASVEEPQDEDGN